MENPTLPHQCFWDSAWLMVQAHRYLYFEMHLPVVSDSEFDRMISTVRKHFKPGHAIHRPAGGSESYTEAQILKAQYLLQCVI